MTPYYQDEAVTIYHADCRDVLPTLEPLPYQADFVITDPPYNAGKNFGVATDDKQPWPEWAAWFDSCLDPMMKAAPNVLSFLSQPAYRAYVRYGQVDIVWSLAWVKPLSLAICAYPFMPHWEHIAYWGEARRKDGLFWGGDVLSHSIEWGKSRNAHPTSKPLLLMRDLISRFDGSVLDPFMGSGTTLRAAKDLGRKAIGIEVEERYCEIAAKRMSQTVVAL